MYDCSTPIGESVMLLAVASKETMSSNDQHCSLPHSVQYSPLLHRHTYCSYPAILSPSLSLSNQPLQTAPYYPHCLIHILYSIYTIYTSLWKHRA